MNDLRELLSAADNQMMFDYVTEFATDGNSDHPSMKNLLRFWSENKSEYLYKLLGEQLMVEKTLTYNKPVNKMVEELSNKFYTYTNACYRFKHEFDRFMWDNRITLGRDYYKLQMLLDTVNLINTKYEDEEFSVFTPEGREIKVQTGCRPMRILSRLAKAYNYNGLDDFVDFQNEVSMVLNQKVLSGRMTLSIHPMDYMTMSHNDSDWSSCMNWPEGGCYRRGTIEMMNSPMVVVAYLASDNDMSFKAYGTKYYWNNKKWRELFIVTKDIITGVKGYPYQNPDLVKLVNLWLKELAEKNLGWKYEDENVCYNHDEVTEIQHEDSIKNISVCFTTNTMYNDFGTIKHYGIFGKDVDSDLYINYSGEEMCLKCGEVRNDFDSEGELVCLDCNNPIYCECCGDRIANEDDAYWLDGERYCYSCYCDKATYDPIDEEDHNIDNMVRVYLLSENDETDLRENDSAVRWAYSFPHIDTSRLWGTAWNRIFNENSRRMRDHWGSVCYYVVPSMFHNENDIKRIFNTEI